MAEASDMQPPGPVHVAHLLPDLQRSLLLLLDDLTEEDWETPTICPGWTVRDIALHLLGVDVGNLSRRRDGFFFRPDDHADDDLGAFVNDINEEWVGAARRTSPRLLRQLLAFVGDAMVDYFAQVDGGILGEPVSWAGPAPAPMWLDVTREYTERWVHQQPSRLTF